MQDGWHGVAWGGGLPNGRWTVCWLLGRRGSDYTLQRYHSGLGADPGDCVTPVEPEFVDGLHLVGWEGSWLGGWLEGRCTLQTRTVLCDGAVVIICSRFSTCSKSLLTTWIPGGANVLIRCRLHKDSCTKLYIYQPDDQALTLSDQGDQEENCCEETFLLHCSFDCLQKTWVPWESKSQNTSHLSLSTKRSRPTNIDGDGGCHQVLGHPAHQTAHSETIARVIIRNFK